MRSFRPHDGTFLKTGTAAASLIGMGPALIRGALAQDADLAPYKAAKIDWQQATGETITVAVIPGELFRKPDFAGAAVQGTDRHRRPLRENSACADPPEGVIDLTSKTGTYATHAADPMYYSLYAANKWVEPLDTYLEGQIADRCSLVQVRRHRPGLAHRRQRRRQALRRALRRRGDDPGLPQGPLRREGPEAGRHAGSLSSPMRPHSTIRTIASGARALRGVAGAGQNMYIYPVDLPRVRRRLDEGR